MAVEVIVFDFDGTLVDSNQLKYDAFFNLFAQDGISKQVITEVLKKFFEESRYVILKEILNRIGKSYTEAIDLEAKIDELAYKYNNLVSEAVKTCKEKTGATRLLKDLSLKYRLYLISTTPKEALRDIIRHRKWHEYFCDIYGYPNVKASALLEIIRNEMVDPNEVLMVGDGEVDRISAGKVGCRFLRVNKNDQLEELIDNADVYLK